LADRLQRLTNELVNRAAADIITSIDKSEEAYLISRKIVISIAVGSIGLALILGYIFSWSLIGPVQEMNARLTEIAAGDFSYPPASCNPSIAQPSSAPRQSISSRLCGAR
jgi:methyl-accepting chemotaxis protein